MRKDLVIGMAGAGGDGVIAAGDALMTAAARGGYRAMMTKSYGPQIRGGESSFRLRIGTGEILNAGATLDIAVALNWDDFLRFGAELPVDGRTTVVHDPSADAPRSLLDGISPAETLAVPIGEMARASAGTEKAKNTVVLGLLAGWLGLAPDGLMAGLRKRFAKKHPEVLVGAERAFDAGLAFAQAHPLRTDCRLSAAETPATPRWLADGNEMCAASALVAGCEFFGGYPITPSSEIMHYLGREIWKHGGTVLQAEDEIAGIGAVIGASFAGRKAMTATSGPGMSLKSEMLGLATIAEVPLVCVNVQRGGPSTGLPTKSEQSDLFQAAFSAHGDAVRPVLAPVSVADTCRITIEAFNIAEQFQTPVILLSDADIAQRKEVVDPIDPRAFAVVNRRVPSEREREHYARFQVTESGVSPVSHPGLEGGTFLASGIEHNEQGAPTASGEMHARMNEKRIRKLAPLKTRRDLFSIEGDREAPIGLVSWGSVAGVASEAASIARREGIQLKLLVPRLLYPISEEVYEDFFASVRAGLVIEQSHQGQLFRIIRMFVDVPRGLESLARSGSNPITVHDVLDRVRSMVMAFQRLRVPQEEPTLG
jgi:2-oxoglutarate ferredoxin oxidoreductase subunit alpha